MNYLSDDYFYLKAKYKGFRSRASYKLLEINQKFHVFKRGHLVVDLGASPGGWSQVASNQVGHSGKVIAVDKAYISQFKEKNVEIVNIDILSENLPNLLLDQYGKIDVLLSDCAPNISGDYSRDHLTQIFLANRALELAEEVLKKGGCFICKLFQGKEFEEFNKKAKTLFVKTKLFKPKASRKKSSEIYLVCLDRLGE